MLEFRELTGPKLAKTWRSLVFFTLVLVSVSQVIVLCDSRLNQQQQQPREFIDHDVNRNQLEADHKTKRAEREANANFRLSSYSARSPDPKSEISDTSQRQAQNERPNDRQQQRVRRRPEVEGQQWQGDNKSTAVWFDESADVEVAHGGRSCFGADELEPLSEEQRRLESLLARYFRVESNYPSKGRKLAGSTSRSNATATATGARHNLGAAAGDNPEAGSGEKTADELPQLPRPTNVTVLIVSWYPPILNLSWTLNELSERQVDLLDFYRPPNGSAAHQTGPANEAKLQEYDLNLALGDSIAGGGASQRPSENQHNIGAASREPEGALAAGNNKATGQRQGVILELKRQRSLVRKSLTCFQVTYNIVNSRFKVTEEYPPHLRSIQMERVLPATEYSLRVVAIYLGKYKLASERVQFISPTDNESRRFKENTYRPIHYYPDEKREPKVGLAHVRSEELTIVAIAVMFWIATICLFFNKWGKIRMLEPYQPAYRDTSAAASAAAAATFAHHHPSLHNLHGSSGATGSLTALGGVGGVAGGGGTGASSLVGLSLVAGGGGGGAKGLSSGLLPSGVMNETAGPQAAQTTPTTGSILLESQRLSGSGSLVGSATGNGGVGGGVGTAAGSLHSAGGVSVAPATATINALPSERSQRQSEGTLVCRKGVVATASATGSASKTANLLRLGNKRFETVAADEFPIRTTRVVGAEDELSFRFHAKAMALARATTIWTKQQQEKQKQMRQHQQQQQQQFRARLTSSVLGGSGAISALAAFRSGNTSAALASEERDQQLKVAGAGTISTPATTADSQDSNPSQRQYRSSPTSIGTAAPLSLPMAKAVAPSPKHPLGLRALKTVSLETRQLQAANSQETPASGEDRENNSKLTVSLCPSASSYDSLALAYNSSQRQPVNPRHHHHHQQQPQLSAQSSLTSCGSSWAQLLRQETLRQQSRAFDFGQNLPPSTGSSVSRSFERQRSDSKSMCAISSSLGGAGTSVAGQTGDLEHSPRPHSAAGLRRSPRTPSASLTVESTAQSQRAASPASTTTIIMTEASGSQTSSCSGSGGQAAAGTSNNSTAGGSGNRLRRLQFMSKLHQHHHIAQSQSTSTLMNTSGGGGGGGAGGGANQSEQRNPETNDNTNLVSVASSSLGHSYSRSLDHQDARVLTLRQQPASGSLYNKRLDKKLVDSDDAEQHQRQQRSSARTGEAGGINMDTSPAISSSDKQQKSDSQTTNMTRTVTPTILLPPKPSHIDLSAKPMAHHILIEPPSPPNRPHSPTCLATTIAGSRSYDYSSLCNQQEPEGNQSLQQRQPYGRLRNDATRSSWSVGQQSSGGRPMRGDDAFVKLAEYQRDLSIQRQQRQQRGQSLVAAMSMARQMTGGACCCLRLQQAQAHLAQCSFCGAGSAAASFVSQVCTCSSDSPDANQRQQLGSGGATREGPSINLSEHQDSGRQFDEQQHHFCHSSTTETTTQQHKRPQPTDDTTDELDGDDNNLRPRMSSVFVASPYSRAHRDSFAMLRALSQKKSKSAEDVAYLSSLVLQIWARDRNPLLQSASQQQLSNSTGSAHHNQRRQSHQAPMERRRQQQRPKPK